MLTGETSTTVIQDMIFSPMRLDFHGRTMPRDEAVDAAQAPEEHHAGHLLLHRSLERIARRVTSAGKCLQARAAIGLHVQPQQPGDLVECLACALTSSSSCSQQHSCEVLLRASFSRVQGANKLNAWTLV